MKRFLLMLLRAVRALRLARCQQATENEILEFVQTRLLANREVNLFLFVVQIEQLNAILEKGANICFTKTEDYDERREEETINGAV